MNHFKSSNTNTISRNNSGRLTKIMAAAVAFAVMAQSSLVFAAVSKEAIVNTYTATPNGQAVINNLKYTDIGNASYDLKDAIYQNGALDLLKGFGNTKFNPNGTVSKETALYLAYMAANRVQDITAQGQALNAARSAAQKKTSLQAILYDGSIQLAANEGLITRQELADAMNSDQSGLEAGDFIRGAAVQRQEFATWLAKALMLPPAYEEQELFNNFSDWNSAIPENVPYIEAVLQNNIMSGDGKGSFNPKKAVTREQAARILKNAENVILPLKSMEKRTATVEDIQKTKDTSKGYRIDYTTLVVRNSDGLLDELVAETRYQAPSTTSNEQTGKVQEAYRTEIPVFRDGTISNSQSLKKGDRLEYIAGMDDRTVRYARVLSNSGEVSYVAAIVNSVANTARTINYTPLTQAVKYPTQDIADPVRQTVNGNVVYENRTYSNNILNAITKGPVNMTSILPDSVVIIGLKQNIVTEIVPITVKKERELGLAAGIVEENNPQLGYLTLYNVDGSGKTPLELSALRTFNYSDPNSVQVYKNHQPAVLEDIEPGDTVFVRIDETGAVSSISSVDNYTVRYGKVVSKKLSSITVETDKGILQYNTDGVNVIKDGRLSKISQLKDGDRVKLLINEAPNLTRLKEITIESGDKLVANIYKGKFSSYNSLSNQILLSDPWVLRKGVWVKDEVEPMKSLRLGDNFAAYYGGTAQPVKDMNKYLPGAVVYLVSERDYGNNENIVMANFTNDLEVPYNDKVYTAGTNRFTLQQALTSITYDKGTIVVKDGRLVQGSSVAANDYAYVVANRDSASGTLVAGVVSVEQRAGTDAVQLYRGRITAIDPYKNVTLQSYSRLSGVNWEYANTPITFTLSADTRITDTDGIVGQGDFISSNSADTFRDRTIYILSNGTNAVEISTAPYGNVNVTGELAMASGGTVDEEGNLVSQPTALELKNCRYYNSSSNIYVSIADSKVNLLANSLVIKNNVRINPSELKKGDKLRILKKDSATTGDAYIVIVEE
ncbi:hypothetical protein CLHUN_13860 [Ruminiclostridium hungatei]|uniref:SLH domain-containing protein n=1 Tax=Ruminiclostridium hungatei TaxID=48256 RepID=A0A1V4SLS0_RUMHU|nr:S-layer homology domain-containing protein [Ruminiclostridium hungatei]OPX44832.1 hypothetical protein CLHUN_13860 [Ruminiclostridium hungatei]